MCAGAFSGDVLLAIASEIRVEALFRSTMKRPPKQFAGGTRNANAASRGGTSDLTTAVRAVAKSEVDAAPVWGDSLEQR
jgi:hypothetical protein